MDGNPYDEVPYRSRPIEWAAPERLALSSLLHGGPRLPLDEYRVLELGCGDGANLIPLAYYRRNATFVGVDGAGGAIAVANTRRAELDLPNLRFVQADFLSAADEISGRFDFILAHGVFSWVPDRQRDALLALCARHLSPGGLLYLNYNTKPGWNVRGMVRDLLRALTSRTAGLRARAELAQTLAGQLAASFATATDHPYPRLMESEFRIVSDGHLSYIAHEYLSPDNHSYWRSEFLSLARPHGFHYVADADFNYASGRVPVALTARVAAARLGDQPVDDTVDLLCYRQLHSAILTSGAWTRRAPEAAELAGLRVACCLLPADEPGSGPWLFRHPTGAEVAAKTPAMKTAFERLRSLWPEGLRVDSLFPNVDAVVEDLLSLHRHHLIELRLIGADTASCPPDRLNQAERHWGDHVTTPYHTWDAVRA